MSRELESSFAELLDELKAAEEKLKSAEPPLNESERVEGYRWLFSLLATALDCYVWADPARPRFTDIVGPYRKWGGDNADACYQYTPIDPQLSYRVHITPGNAVYFSLTIYGGPSDGHYSTRIVGKTNNRELQANTDGSYDLWLSAEPPADNQGNWIRLEDDAVCGLTRDYFADPDNVQRAQWSIEAVNAPQRKDDSPQSLARGFRAARVWFNEQAQMCPLRITPVNQVQEPYPVPKETFGWAAGDASYAMGSFELEAGQSLLIEGRSPDCVFWNLCLWNPFMHTFDYAYDRVTINGEQLQCEADGSWKIWIADTDPGHPNWLSTQGHARGLLWFRWFLPEDAVERPRATLYDADGKPVTARRASRPDPVRLDDLDKPRFPMMMRPIIKMLGIRARGIDLQPDALCTAAEKQTGLRNWGDEAFRERLEVLCGALRNEAGLSDLGKVTVGGALGNALANRLRIEDLIARHPEIEAIAIERPIVIAGMPRTGTTHLHNLLSADPNLRHLPYWESLEPVLADAEQPKPGKPDPRIGRCAQAVTFIDGLVPHFKRMHEMTVDHAHEEIQLLANDISGMLFETLAHVPSWRDHYKAHDQTPSYRYLRRSLQALTWLRNREQDRVRWVLKSPQHLEQFGPLLNAFPDATVVITHRDPVAVTASMATMIAYSRRLSTARPDVKTIGKYWAERAADLLNGCLQGHDQLPAAQTVDISLDEFMADEMAVIKRIYQTADQPLEALSLSKMAEYVDANPRGRHGSVIYDLQNLGLKADSLRRQMQAYRDRFGLRDEQLQ